MTRTQNLAALQAAGEARPVPMTRKQLLEHVAAHFAQKRRQTFKMPLEIEHMTPQQLRAMPVVGNMFAEVATALGTAGVPTDGTMGSVMDPLGFNQAHAHVFCGCHAREHDGYTIELAFKGIAQNV